MRSSERVVTERYATVTAFAPAARAWLRGPLGTPFGPAPRDAPGYLLDAVVEWARQPPEPDPIGVIVSMELPLTWSTVGGALMPALATGSSVAVVASDFQTSAIAGAVQGRFGGTVPQASLTLANKSRFKISSSVNSRCGTPISAAVSLMMRVTSGSG